MKTIVSFRNNAWNNFNWLLAGLALALTVPVREASGQGPAQVSTGPADCITGISATLNGHFSWYWTGSGGGAFGFNWGTTTNYGNSLTVFQGPMGGPGSQDFVGDVSGLSPGTTYHYSAWGNPAGSGGDASFTTRPTVFPAQFTFTTNDGVITITGYTGPVGPVTIPDTITGLPVTSIGIGAFSGCLSRPILTGVTIPNSITNIADSAFYKCASLINVLIPNSVINIGGHAFDSCASLANVMIGNSVTTIGSGAFGNCTGLTNHVTIPNSVTGGLDGTFGYCSSLTSVTIGNSVTEISGAFNGCTRLTSVTIGNSVTDIDFHTFSLCASLTNIMIPDSVTTIGPQAFIYCSNLRGVYFRGNAPSLLGGSYSGAFAGDDKATVYYLPGTTGWGATYGGLPTALWIQVPTVLNPPRTQTAEAGSAVRLGVKASSPLPLFYFWYLKTTNLLSSGTNCELDLASVQLSQSGAYTVVVSNVLGATTSAPAMLNVIAAVERRPVPGVKVTGQTGSLLNVDYANSLLPAPGWTMLGSIRLTGTSGYCFDPTLPLPAQRYYRAWQTTPPSQSPVMDLRMVPALTVTGSVGGSVHVDYINRFGPIAAWVTLNTVTLTNTSQPYFDVSALGQPERLYRLVQIP